MLTLCLSILGACSEREPAGVVLLANPDPAARAALGFWGEDPTVTLPTIVGVLADPACEKTRADGRRYVGFLHPDGGHCVGGYTHMEASKIYLLVHPEVGYSAALPHELQHWLRGDGDHRLRGVWEPPIGESDTNLVPRASEFLRMFPVVDTMAAVE